MRRLATILKILLVLALLAFGLWVWSLRIEYCMQASDLSWWQCALVQGGRR
jgi:uncharacterized membrane protein YpjA